MEKPLFEHDCSACIFLGTFEADGRQADLYYHDCGDPTVIARYSSEGSDYSSSLHFIMHNPHLNEAYKRAKELDLVRPEVKLYYELDYQIRSGGLSKIQDDMMKISKAEKNFERMDNYWDFRKTCDGISRLLCDLMFDEERVKKFKEEAPARQAEREKHKLEWEKILTTEED